MPHAQAAAGPPVAQGGLPGAGCAAHATTFALPMREPPAQSCVRRMAPQEGRG